MPSQCPVVVPSREAMIDMIFHLIAEYGNVNITSGEYYVCSPGYSILEHVMREFEIPADCSQEQLWAIQAGWRERTSEAPDAQ